MNKVWIYTIVFYKKTEEGESLMEFMSFPFSSFRRAKIFRQSFEKRENIKEKFSKDYHWESIIEEKEINNYE